MKVEQACRFRTSEGYGITAKTPGFDRNQERVFADAFNDSLIPVFTSLGNSILSCSVEKGYALYAKNTLRTHETRKVIFTHGYIMSREDYAQMMQQMPQRLLAVPASALMDIQTCGENLEQVDFPGTQYGELSLEKLVSKYHLDTNRYSRLLMGAYEAMTSNRSLLLYTDAPVECREQLVRELTYCIVEGLLPVMKGKVSFSSGADTRMDISVLPDGKGIKHGDLVFGVEDDAYTNINFRDELSAACFRTLGSASWEERKDLLEKMQNWLCEKVNVEEGLTLLQICAAFIYNSGQKMTYDVAFGLFRGFQNVAGKSMSIKNADALLTELVAYMIDNNMVTTNAVSHFAQWYLMDSSDAFRRKADVALKETSVQIRVALVEAILQMPPSQNAHELINILVAGMPADSPELSNETREQLILWIIQEDDDELAGFCEEVMGSYTDVQITVLSQHLLSNAQNRVLNHAENAVIVKSLHHMVTSNTWFSLQDYSRLDRHLEEFTDDQMDVIVMNCLRVRTQLYSEIQDRVDLLIRMGELHPAFRGSLEKQMGQGQQDAEQKLLWEHYQTQTIFTQDVDGSEVSAICQKYNAFQSADGPFERKACALWSQYIKERMAAEVATGKEHRSEPTYQKQLGKEFKQANALATAFLDEANKMRVSRQSKDRLRARVAEVFWNLISYDHIVYGDLKVAHELQEIEICGARMKQGILIGCARVMTRPDQADLLIEIVQSCNWTDKQWDDIQHLLAAMVCRVIVKKSYVSWDLLLLASWLGGDDYDMDCLNEYLLTIDKWRKEKNITVRSFGGEDSVLLKNDALRKQVRRHISSESPLGLKLAESLKAGGKKPLGRREEKPARQPNPSADRPGHSGKDGRNDKGRNANPAQTQPAGNRLVQFDDQPAPQQPEKKGIFSNLFGKKGK